MAIFTFTRNPSTKVAVETEVAGLVQADSTLVIIGKKAATGGSVTAGVPTPIDNFGDPVAAATEATAKFGASSEIGEMIVGAIDGVLKSNLAEKVFPKIVALPMLSTAVAGDLAAFLAGQLTLPMPYVVCHFAATDATARSALKAHVEAISAMDRGDNGQFGSFGFMATDEVVTATATAAGEAAASKNMCIPWLKDSAATKANKLHVVASAYAALCAGLAVPFLPLNDVRIGGLVAPVSAADRHTSGDTGTVSLGLDSGLSPLKVNTAGEILISRSITTSRVVSSVPDTAYYDMQDFQVLFYLRKNAYALAMQPRYKRAKATDTKLKSLKSELVKLCVDFQDLEMLQHVEKFANQFTVVRVAANRNAAVYRIPVNVVPGFHHKGIGLVGTTQFDLLVA